MKNKSDNSLFIILVVGMVLYIMKDKLLSIFQRNKENDTLFNSYNEPPVVVGSTIDDNKQYKKGDRHEDVKKIQQLLNTSLGYLRHINKKDPKPWMKNIPENLVTDGIFGQKTDFVAFYVTHKHKLSVLDAFNSAKELHSSFEHNATAEQNDSFNILTEKL